MNKYAAKSNLLVARLQRTKPFCAGAPVQYDYAPLLAEAKEWLTDIEHSIDKIPDAELLPALDNYDLLHRIVRHTPGTALLRYAYSRILRNASGKSIADIDSYVIDAYYKLKTEANTESDLTGCKDLTVDEDLTRCKEFPGDEELTECKELTGGEEFEFLTTVAPTHRRNCEDFKILAPSEFLTKQAPTTKAITGGEEFEFLTKQATKKKFPNTILRYWSNSLSNPLTPLPSMPELIARLRLLLQSNTVREELTGGEDFTGGEEFEFLTTVAPTHRRHCEDLPAVKLKQVKILAPSEFLTKKSSTKQATPIYINYAINLLRNSLKEPASSSVLHALLTLTIRLKPALAGYINVERTISRLQKKLAEAPDNHPLDRAARRQTLDNTEAFAKALALSSHF